jgi:tRNA (cytidine56-2'-O)-methyltransferase
MDDTPEVAVLRLGHRPGRDERITTHVGLTARALGADRVLLAGDAASRADTVRDITDRFGGLFAADTLDSWRPTLEEWDGRVVHLTMYGLPIQDVEDEIRTAHREDRESLLVVVGAEKVPFEVYEAADWNVGVTSQPHSEIASLAVFLDRLFEGRELDREWDDAEKTVVPQAAGKKVVDSQDHADADQPE